jgi:hypothetical protein
LPVLVLVLFCCGAGGAGGAGGGDGVPQLIYPFCREMNPQQTKQEVALKREETSKATRKQLVTKAAPSVTVSSDPDSVALAVAAAAMDNANSLKAPVVVIVGGRKTPVWPTSYGPDLAIASSLEKSEFPRVFATNGDAAWTSDGADAMASSFGATTSPLGGAASHIKRVTKTFDLSKDFYIKDPTQQLCGGVYVVSSDCKISKTKRTHKDVTYDRASAHQDIANARSM